MNRIKSWSVAGVWFEEFHSFDSLTKLGSPDLIVAGSESSTVFNRDMVLGWAEVERCCVSWISASLVDDRLMCFLETMRAFRTAGAKTDVYYAHSNHQGAAHQANYLIMKEEYCFNHVRVI